MYASAPEMCDQHKLWDVEQDVLGCSETWRLS